MEKMKLPDYIEKVIDRIEDMGYEAYVVGGSVRDFLLGNTPSDYDITTNALPEELEKIFEDYRTVDVGKDFGTIAVIIEGEMIEITSYRIEDDYIDGRRPSKVEFTRNLREDLSRRDLTINAMAYNHRTGIIDYFDGRDDLRNRVIRTVGSPEKRFSEDHLRILRSIRFACRLDFRIEEETFKACIDHRESLRRVSRERIRDELFGILLADRPSIGLSLLEETGILKVILPELSACVDFDQRNPHHDKDVFSHTLCVVDETEAVLKTRLAGLFHDIGKPETFQINEEGIGNFYGHEKVGEEIARKILRRFNSPNKLIEDVCLLVREHMGHHERMTDRAIRRLIYRVREDNVYSLYNLQRADIKCSLGTMDESLIDERIEDTKRVIKESDIYGKNKLDIDGYDIINLDYQEGRIIGEILDFLMEKVLDNPELNEKDKLIDLIKKNF